MALFVQNRHQWSGPEVCNKSCFCATSKNRSLLALSCKADRYADRFVVVFSSPSIWTSRVERKASDGRCLCIVTAWRRNFVVALCLERQKASADSFWIHSTLFSVLQFFFSFCYLRTLTIDENMASVTHEPISDTWTHQWHMNPSVTHEPISDIWTHQ